MGTLTGAPTSSTTGVGTGSSVKAISAATWAAGLLEALQAAGYKAPITANNIANLNRVTAAETGNQQGGFLRDNNPWNLNSYSGSSHSLPGGQIVTEFGTQIQQFDSVEQSYTAYVNQLQANPALLAAINNNASPAVFGGALSTSGWKGASYANATTFPTLTPYTGTSAVGGQGLTFSPSKGLGAVENAGKTVGAAVTAPVSTIDGFIKEISNVTTWKNVGIFVAGLALVVTGVVILVSESKAAALRKVV